VGKQASRVLLLGGVEAGASNVMADALSRRDTEVLATTFAISAPTFTLFDNLCVEYTTDPALTKLRLEVL
jgi:hypothetical protein